VIYRSKWVKRCHAVAEVFWAYPHLAERYLAARAKRERAFLEIQPQQEAHEARAAEFRTQLAAVNAEFEAECTAIIEEIGAGFTF
jgi:hypothetical protein